MVLQRASVGCRYAFLVNRTPVYDHRALWKGRALSCALIAALSGAAAYAAWWVPIAGVMVALAAVTAAMVFALATVGCLFAAHRPPERPGTPGVD